MPSKIVNAILFSAYFWQFVVAKIEQSFMINGHPVMSATAGANWDPKGQHTIENSHSMNVPGLPSPIEHQSKFQQSSGQTQHENSLNIPGMPGIHPDIHHQQFFNIQHDQNMPMPHMFDQQHLNTDPMDGYSPEQQMMGHHPDNMPQIDPSSNEQQQGGMPKPHIQHMHTLNIGGPHGFQHQSHLNIFHPQPQPIPPPPPPAPAPEPEPSAPPKPEDGILPWDKATLLQEMTNAYTQSCKKSDVITMSPAKKMELITASKKQPVKLDQFEWVVDVDKVCDFLNLVPEIMHKRVDCFQITITPEFSKAMQMHGVQQESRIHGDLYYRYLVCDLMRKFEEEELKATRQLAVDDHKNGIIDVMLNEHKQSRSLLATGSWVIVLHSFQNASVFFWQFADYLEYYHTRHFLKKEGDVCQILHTDAHFYDYFIKLTNGTDKKFDEAINQLKGVMHALPLDPSPNQYGDENCTYNLFLLRPVLELFLSLINSLLDEQHGWFRKNYHVYNKFCSEKMQIQMHLQCTFENLSHVMNEYKKMAMENINEIKAWLGARGHGKIHEDFSEFEGRIAGKFTVNIPDAPPPKPTKTKYSIQMGDGTIVTNKMKHDPLSQTTRMKTKVYNPYDGNVVKSKSRIQNEGPYGHMPAHINSRHQFNAGQFQSDHSFNMGGGIAPNPHPNTMQGLGAHLPSQTRITTKHNINAGPGGHFQSNRSFNMHHAPPHLRMGGLGAQQAPMGGGLGGPPMGTGMDIQSNTNIHGPNGHSISKRVRFNTGHPHHQSPQMHEQINIGGGNGAGGMPINSECMYGGRPDLKQMHLVVFVDGNPEC